jgi:hypothetical protein
MLLTLKQWLICWLCLIILGCSVSAQTSPPIPSTQTVLPVFQAILPALQHQTQVAIVLPTHLPTDALVPDNTGKPYAYIHVPITQDGQFERVYAHVIDAEVDRYEISLDATSTCEGQDSCSLGLLSGQRLHPGDKTIQQTYAFEQTPDFQPIGRSPETMGEVSLAQGIQGYFVPFVCGANCDTSKVIWEQNGDRYTVGIRYASKATVIDFANSVIQNER